MTHFPTVWRDGATLPRDWRGQRGKMTHFQSVRRDASTFTMDWRGRGTETRGKVAHFFQPFGASIFTMDWPGRATERVVK